MIKEIWDTTALEMLDEKTIVRLREKYKNTFCANDRKFLEKTIFNYNKNTPKDVARAIVLYIIFDNNNAIDFAREKGVFRYKSFGMNQNRAAFYLKEITKRIEYFDLSEKNKSYLKKKEQCEWMLDYYVKVEQKLRKKIRKHSRKKNYYKRNGGIVETTFFLELLACLEMVFRYDDGSGKKGAATIDRNVYSSYSKEEIGEAISYLIYLYTDEVGIDDRKSYWLDTDFVFSSELEEMILLACKYNTLIEWEMLVDYYGFDIDEKGHEWIIADKTSSLEKSIRIGYVKQIMQEVVFNMKQKHETNECSLEKLAEVMVGELGDRIIKFEQEGDMSRYRLIMDERLIKAFGPKDFNQVAFYTEEIDTIKYMARELLITPGEMCLKKVTEHCTMQDLLLFKRFFVMVVFVQRYIFEKEQNPKYVAASVTPVFWEHQLLPLLDMFTGDRIKTTELLELLTWDGKNKLDLQYTPIFRVGKRYYFTSATLAMANSCRNSIVNSYYLKKQILNSDGCIDPLVLFCEKSFKECKQEYLVNKNLKFNFQGQEGEIDFIASTGKNVFIFECKAPIHPTSSFEMRTTFDYIKKANKQLTHCVNAFNNLGFREKYFRQWGLSPEIENIYTCILMGNRLFSGYNKFSHPIRYIYELDMVLNRGEIKSNAGKWNYWQSNEYSENELIRFLSESDPLTKCFFESMVEYKENMTCGEEIVTYISYYYNTYQNIKCNDKYFRIVDKNVELREKLAQMFEKEVE